MTAARGFEQYARAAGKGEFLGDGEFMLEKLIAILSTEPRAEIHRDRERFVECQFAAAVLLIEAAYLDQSNSKDEIVIARDLINEHIAKSALESKAIVNLAMEALQISIDDCIFTATVREMFLKAEKFAIVEMLWEVIYSGQTMSRLKDDWVHRIAKEIGLDVNDAEEVRAIAFSRVAARRMLSV